MSNLPQSIPVAIFFSYIAFCIIYAYCSLGARRASGRTTRGPFPHPRLYSRFAAKVGVAIRNSFVLLVPIAAITIILGVSGRERIGVVEPRNLFTVTARSGFDLEFLSQSPVVQRGQTIARFASEAGTHRLQGLQARRAEAVALQKALAASEFPISGALRAKAQSSEHDLAQTDRKLSELESARLQAQQTLVSAETSWLRARNDLLAHVPQFEHALALANVELETSRAAHQRIARLRQRGYATVTQLEATTISESKAFQRLESANAAIISTRAKLETVDEGFNRMRKLLDHQLVTIAGEIEKSRDKTKQLEFKHRRLQAALAADSTAAVKRRNHELQGAEARVAQLEKEIAAAEAANHVRSPISGRVLYRNMTSSTLSGSMPLMVIASDPGFVMRVEMAHEEIEILQASASLGESVEVLLNDTVSKRLVSARLTRSDGNPINRHRASAVFSLDVPEDMLVRMALKGTTPLGSLQWSPSPVQIAKYRMQALLGMTDEQRRIVHQKPEQLVSKKVAGSDTTL